MIVVYIASCGRLNRIKTAIIEIKVNFSCGINGGINGGNNRNYRIRYIS